MFNTWYRDPEAFSGEYDEYRKLMRGQAEETTNPCVTECEGCDSDVRANCEHFISPHAFEHDALDYVREQAEASDYPESVGQDISEYDEGGEYGECEWED